ncbi:MAG: hypothetical protein AB7S38_20225 [Vulcanimicrobiota bacterium]
MLRVFAMFLVVTGLEVFAFWIHREHPIIKPDYWKTLLLFAQLGMSWGGLEACRWLLRRSPVAKLKGPVNDWTKLWLWTGPIGGLLLTKACLLGYLVHQYSESKLAGPLVVGHICGGALLWLVALPWAIQDVLADETIGLREKILLNLGIGSHLIGFVVYFTVYPAQTVPVVSLLSSLFFFYFILYYLMMVQLKWSLIFRFWKPSAEAPTVASLHELAEPTRYLDAEEAE